MRRRLFIITIFLLVAVGFTSESFAVKPGTTQPVLQAIQREFNADILWPVNTVEAGRFTVPSNKRLVIELISLQVLSNFGGQVYQVFATTSIGTYTVKHPIGPINFITDAHREAPGSGIIESFPRTIYADPDTDVIFTVHGQPQTVIQPTPVKVTFSGRLIDVP